MEDKVNFPYWSRRLRALWECNTRMEAKDEKELQEGLKRETPQV